MKILLSNFSVKLNKEQYEEIASFLDKTGYGWIWKNPPELLLTDFSPWDNLGIWGDNLDDDKSVYLNVFGQDVHWSEKVKAYSLITYSELLEKLKGNVKDVANDQEATSANIAHVGTIPEEFAKNFFNEFDLKREDKKARIKMHQWLIDEVQKVCDKVSGITWETET